MKEEQQTVALVNEENLSVFSGQEESEEGKGEQRGHKDSFTSSPFLDKEVVGEEKP